MAFPTTSVLDDFNTGAGQNLTARAGWRASTMFGTSLQTDAGPTYATAPGATGTASAEWNAVLAADQEVWVAFNVAPTNTWQLFIRTDVVTGNGYIVSQGSAGGTITLQRWTGFGNSVVTGTATQTISAGDAVGMDCVGTTISAYYKPAAGAWSQIITGTDATYSTSGRIGVATFGATATQYDSFGGGALATGTPDYSLPHSTKTVVFA